MLASSLSDDIAALKRMLASRDETIAQLVAEIARCVFRTKVTGCFGIVTGDFGNVTGRFENVTERTGRQEWRCA